MSTSCISTLIVIFISTQAWVDILTSLYCYLSLLYERMIQIYRRIGDLDGSANTLDSQFGRNWNWTNGQMWVSTNGRVLQSKLVRHYRRSIRSCEYQGYHDGRIVAIGHMSRPSKKRALSQYAPFSELVEDLSTLSLVYPALFQANPTRKPTVSRSIANLIKHATSLHLSSPPW